MLRIRVKRLERALAAIPIYQVCLDHPVQPIRIIEEYPGIERPAFVSTPCEACGRLPAEKGIREIVVVRLGMTN